MSNAREQVAIDVFFALGEPSSTPSRRWDRALERLREMMENLLLGGS